MAGLIKDVGEDGATVVYLDGRTVRVTFGLARGLSVHVGLNLVEAAELADAIREVLRCIPSEGAPSGPQHPAEGA